MSEPTISLPLPRRNRPASPRLQALRAENQQLKNQLAEQKELQRLEQENARMRDQLEHVGERPLVPRFPPGFKLGH